MKSDAIILERVSKIYSTGKIKIKALNNINLKIQDGEFVVILGPSGSGKSTLLNIIGGIDKPSEGEVIIYGHKLSEMDEKSLTEFRRKYIGFVFQFFNLIPTLTAKENVILSLELKGIKRKEAEKRAIELLNLVGLKDRADHFPHELSGGQQQRVAIARALAKEPKILLCDEPTGELDVESGKRVLSVIKRINEIKGVTVILVTHNTAIANIASRVIRLRDGRIVEDYRIENPVTISELKW